MARSAKLSTKKKDIIAAQNFKDEQQLLFVYAKRTFSHVDHELHSLFKRNSHTVKGDSSVSCGWHPF